MRQHSVGRRRVRTLCLVFGGLRVRTRGLPYEREALTQGRARRTGLSWSGVVHVEGTGPAMDGARQIARRADAQRGS